MADLPAGWYDDGSGTQRWWDGRGWTEHVHQPQEHMVGQYRLVSEIGRGSFGRVYEAFDPSGTRVALKAFADASPQARAAVAHEAAALLAVRSEHCLQVVEVIDTPQMLALVTDFVPGATLRQVIDAAGVISGPQALTVMWGAAQGLAAVHAAGLVHGDVKPANILVTPDGASRLIDFGLVGLPGSGADGSTSGSPAYAAPEQMSAGTRSVQSDIYAMAVTVFEALCGQRPFSAGSLQELSDLHARAPIPDPRQLNPQLSPSMAGLLMQGMAKDPSARPATVADFLTRFQQAAEETYGAAWFAPAAVAAVLSGTAGGALLATASGASAGVGSAAVQAAAAAPMAPATATGSVSANAAAVHGGFLATAAGKVAAGIAVAVVVAGGGSVGLLAATNSGPFGSSTSANGTAVLTIAPLGTTGDLAPGWTTDGVITPGADESMVVCPVGSVTGSDANTWHCWTDYDVTPYVPDDPRENSEACVGVPARDRMVACVTGGPDDHQVALRPVSRAFEPWQPNPSPEPAYVELADGSVWQFAADPLLRTASTDSMEQGMYICNNRRGVCAESAPSGREHTLVCTESACFDKSAEFWTASVGYGLAPSEDDSSTASTGDVTQVRVTKVWFISGAEAGTAPAPSATPSGTDSKPFQGGGMS